MEQMNELHRTRDDVTEPGDAEKRTQLLEWLAFHNPFAGKEATYYVAEDDGKIVAFQGRMPVEFAIDGSRQKGYYIHDTYVHPDYRTKGLGFSLITALAQTTEQQSDAFFCVLGGTPLNLKIQRRMGYHELPPAPQFVKLLNPHKQLTKLLKLRPMVNLVNPLARAALALTDAIVLRINDSHLNTFPVERFDQRFDHLMDRIRNKIGVCSWKHAHYLNWRYIDRPFKRDTVFAVEEDATLRGFIVLALSPYRTGTSMGVIVDIMADPDDRKTLAALYSRAIRFFRDEKADAISCILTNKPMESVLMSFLFRRDNTGKAVLLGNLNSHGVQKEQLMHLNHWHITRGDSDSFMLSA
jgi:GNAT superfamily N-acetyltransferase